MPEAPVPWLSFKAWSAARFGRPVFRIPIDPGWGCPHRKRGTMGGCTFCAEDGARAPQLGTSDAVMDQMRRATTFARERYRAESFQLYLQAYTATHASVSALRACVEPLLEAQEFVSLSLGTRPDCLPPEMLDLLREWNREREVWVELGIQTVHDDTLLRLHRHHTWAQSQEAIRSLHANGLQVCAHLLFGLPGEDSTRMLRTVEEVLAAGIEGVKLHNLHVLRDSVLGAQWRKAPFPVLSEREYLDLLIRILPGLPADLPVFRLFTDSPPAKRLAPPREFSKGQFLLALAQGMSERKCWQGSNGYTTNR